MCCSSRWKGASAALAALISLATAWIIRAIDGFVVLCCIFLDKVVRGLLSIVIRTDVRAQSALICVLYQWIPRPKGPCYRCYNDT